MAETCLDYSAQGTDEHMTGCKFLELLASGDRIDAGRLARAELIVRKIQMIHERCERKLLQLTSGNNNGLDDDVHLLLGTYETRGNVRICPELQKWLGKEVSDKALWDLDRLSAAGERV